jgi:hypothetical protein
MIKPKWSEGMEAVAEWVIKERRHALLRAQGLEESQAAVFKVGEFTHVWDEQIYSTEEATDQEPNDEQLAVEAVEAAKLGFPKKLARHFENVARAMETKTRLTITDTRLNITDYAPGYAPTLTPEMLRLMAEFGSGKRKRKRGSLPLTKWERMARYPVHSAAMFLYPAVMQVLSEEYPDQLSKDHHDYALYIVELERGVKVSALNKCLQRSSGERQRIR